MQRTTHLLVLIILLLTACNRDQDVQVTSVVTPSAQTVTPVATVNASETPVFTAPITETETLAPLTIWIPPEFSNQNELESSGFGDLLLTFTSGRFNLEVEVEQKSVGGGGSILDYLRTGHSVAPTILPDLILIPADQLSSAANEGLIYPIDDSVDATILDDFYPAAMAIARPEDETLGLPLALTRMSHLVYKSNVVTSTISLIWDNLISEMEGQIIIPAAGEQGAVLMLELYLAVGGQLFNEAGQATLETEPLVAALRYLDSARSGEFIAAQSSNLASLDEAWQLFQSGSVVLTQTTADFYLRQRSEALSTGAAPIPGPTSALTPLVDSWVWAISTSDPSRKALAGELLTFLASEPYLGTWSYEARFLPARRQAFAQWPPGDPYVVLLQQELERAQPFPLIRNHNIMIALGNAAFDVISLSKTPEAAASAAVSSLQP